jgi:hypothetical protein
MSSTSIFLMYCILNKNCSRMNATTIFITTCNTKQHDLVWLGLCILCHFQQYFSYIMVVSFFVGGNWSTWRKPLTCRKSLTIFITWCCIEYTSPWMGFEHTTLVVIFNILHSEDLVNLFIRPNNLSLVYLCLSYISFLLFGHFFVVDTLR